MYDVVIPYHPKDEEILTRCITSLKKYAANVGTIYIISAAQPALPPTEGVKWVPETAYPMSIHDVQAILQSKKGREGWYLQQFLKLYCFQAIPGIRSNVLLFDSDVVLLKRVRFIDPLYGALLLDWGEQHNAPYFEHAAVLLGTRFKKAMKGRSGITDHLMTSREIVDSLLKAIEDIHKKPAWRAILELIPDRDRDGAGFSEYEVLFNWSLQYFPKKVKMRKLVHGIDLEVFHHHSRPQRT
jgi:hypothetical protein